MFSGPDKNWVRATRSSLTLGVMLFAVVSATLAQSELRDNQPDWQNQASPRGLTTINKAVPTERTIDRPSANSAQRDNEKLSVAEFSIKRWLIRFIEDPIATFTGLLFIATVLLWLATRSLWKDAKRSADITFVSSMPLLSPLVVWQFTNLHPLSTELKTFLSHVSFVFENFGKTPAIIRELRAKVFLCELDRFPDVDFGNLPAIGYE